MDYFQLLKDAIDTHVHIAPDPHRQRRVDAYEAVSQARDAGMRGLVIKSHDYMTTPLAITIGRMDPSILLFGGVTLDEVSGGLNPALVEAAGRLKSKLIWMPTFSARHDQAKHGHPDQGITILEDDGRVKPVVQVILKLIKTFNMTLATGHLSTQEIFLLLEEADRVGLKRIIVTHPCSIGYGPTMTIDDQRRMVRDGLYFEHCYITCMPTSDRQDPRVLAEAIRAVGPEHCIMATDFGQIANPLPAEGLRMFIQAMLQHGLTEEDIRLMVQDNPAEALGL
jgi:Family of unknown function (DUF6282)